MQAIVELKHNLEICYLCTVVGVLYVVIQTTEFLEKLWTSKSSKTSPDQQIDKQQGNHLKY